MFDTNMNMSWKMVLNDVLTKTLLMKQEGHWELDHQLKVVMSYEEEVSHFSLPSYSLLTKYPLFELMKNKETHWVMVMISQEINGWIEFIVGFKGIVLFELMNNKELYWLNCCDFVEP